MPPTFHCARGNHRDFKVGLQLDQKVTRSAAWEGSEDAVLEFTAAQSAFARRQVKVRAALKDGPAAPGH